MWLSFPACASLLILHVAMLPAAVLGQSAGALPSLAVPPMELELGSANAVLDTDRQLHADADAVLRRSLVEYGAFTLLDPSAVQGALSAVRSEANGCQADACWVAAGRRLTADYVLLTRLTKLSNLIWFLNARLVDASSGEVVALEDLELKGAPQDMVPSGARIAARRISRPEERSRVH